MKDKRWLVMIAVVAVLAVSGLALAVAVAGRGESGSPSENAPITTIKGVVFYGPGERPALPPEAGTPTTVTFGNGTGETGE